LVSTTTGTLTTFPTSTGRTLSDLVTELITMEVYVTVRGHFACCRYRYKDDLGDP
jgi:hypothetical protein